MDILTWAFSWSANKLLTYALNEITDKKELEKKLNEETQKWAKELNPKLEYPDAIFSINENSKNKPERQKLTKNLERGIIPKEKIWKNALLESFKETKETQGENAHTFFKKEEKQVEKDINKLAKILFHTCIENDNLFKRNIFNNINLLDKEIKDVSYLIKEVNNKVNIINKTYGTELNFKKEKINKNKVPNILERISKRKEKVEELIDRFSINNWISIYGGISTGKTQLSLLIVRKINKKIIWIKLKEIPEENHLQEIKEKIIKQILNKKRKIKNKKINNTIIVIEDLKKIDPKSEICELLIEIGKLCIENSIWLITTSNHILPTTIINEFENKIYNYNLPLLNKKEIIEILEIYECREKNIQELLKIIILATNGHPPLVLAICQYLKAKEWNYENEELNNIINGNFKENLDSETYQQILNTINDKQSRELLYRLTIPFTGFNFKEVKLIGEIKPEIDLIAERFLTLVGIWIKKNSEKGYEVSPLIKTNSYKPLDKNIEKRINIALAKNILKKESINQFDFKKAFNYLISAKSFNRAGVLFINYLQFSFKNLNAYYANGINFIWLNTKLPNEMDLFLKIYIRTIQILLENKSHNSLSNFLKEDLYDLIEEGNKNGIDISGPSLLLSNIYAKIDPPKSLNLLETAIISSENNRNENKLNPIKLNRSIEDSIWGHCINITNIEQLKNWLRTIKLNYPTKLNYESDSELMEFACEIIQINLTDYHSNENWDELIEIYKYLQRESLELGLNILWTYAIKGEILVYSQKKKDINKARITAELALQKIKGNKTCEFLLNDVIGRELFYNGNREASFNYIAEALDIPLKKFQNAKIETFLVMSKLLENDITSSTIYTKYAYEYIINNNSAFINSVTKAQVIGEYAINTSLQNDYKKSIYLMSDGYNYIINSYSDSNNENVTILRYAHVLNYWNHIIKGEKIPTQTFDGHEYTLPKLGIFNTNNYPVETVNRYFFPERNFLGMILLIDCFEFYGDFDKSNYWATKALDSDRGNPIDIFFTVFNKLSIYTIFSNEADRGMELQLAVIDKINDFKYNSSKIKSKYNNEVIKYMLDFRPSIEINEPDEVVMDFFIAPLIFYKSLQLINNQIDISDFSYFLKDFINNWRRIFKSEYIPNNLIEIIDLYSDNTKSGEFFINFGNNINENAPPSLKMVSYLFASLLGQPYESLRTHLAIILRLNSLYNPMFNSVINFILIPFFEKFWEKMFMKYPDSFSQRSFWIDKSWPYFQSSPIKEKIKNLFKILCHHLNHSPSSEIEDWLHS